MAPARDFTRRHFLEGLAASSIAMPAIVPGSVLGRDDKAAPCERITVGFIGCGKMAIDYHLHELLRFGDVQALAVCEVDRTRRGHHRNWLDSIRSRKRPLADVEIGARSVAITILGNLASWNGRHLRWDPAKWEFVDGAEANRWLYRERRDPWQLPAV
jgi:hypothetical protein